MTSISKFSKIAKIVLLIEILFFLCWRFSGLAPNTIPYGSPLFLLLVTLSFYIPVKFKRMKWKDMGLTKFKSSNILIAVFIGITISLISYFVLLPFFEYLTNSPFDKSYFDKIRGDLPMLGAAIGVSILYAGFAEELIYRGYLLNRLIVIIGDKKYATIIGILISSIIFGLAHTYQGITGVLASGTTGLLLALVYLKFDRNLWMVIITHSIIDIIAAFLIYFGLF